jgi:hypothetical protein
MDFDPLKDYYRTLRIPVDANLEMIKKAYRARAMECHPDRGGTHLAMLDVIEAFQILADPETRRHYEQARRELSNQNAQIVIASDISRARQKSENYPANWDEFESWSDFLFKDFANAKYGKTELMGFNFSTVSNSSSGGVFWVIGGIVGFYIIFKIINSTGIGINGATVKIAVFGIFAGAAVAVGFHKEIGDAFRGGNPENNSNASHKVEPEMPQNAIIRCLQCSQKLRVLSAGKPIQIRCPKCNFVFDFMP